MKWSHVGEFLIGLLAASAFDLVVFVRTGATEARPTGGDRLTPLILAHTALTIVTVGFKRPYLAAGTVAAAILPLLAFMACAAAFRYLMHLRRKR
jgi:hypothetical protein